MTPTHKSYTFSTLQELVDQVPASRIPACMQELGVILSAAKSSAQLFISVAQDLAGQKDTPHTERCIDLPPQGLTWIDDGKGELGAHMKHDQAGDLFSVRVKTDSKE